MAAAEHNVYIALLVASLPVILSPIVEWVASRSRISKELATIDYLNKRLDFLERLNKLRTQLAEDPIRPFLDTEIEHCEAFLRQPRTFIPRSAEIEVAARQSRLAQFFLTQRAVSTRKRIFKGLFWFYFGLAILLVPLGLTALFIGPSVDFPSAWASVGYFVMCLGLALLFRLLAR
jgi:hypothetical protein